MPTLTLNIDDLKGDFVDLADLVCALERLTGAKITLRNVVTIETENMPAYYLLKDLFKPEAVDVLPAQVTGVFARSKGLETKDLEIKVVGETKSSVELEATRKERKPMRAWTVEGEPEKISKDELQERLTKGTFNAGQKLHHPRSGWMVVAKAENPGDPDVLVGLGEWKGAE
jgi:hypothetical protein